MSDERQVLVWVCRQVELLGINFPKVLNTTCDVLNNPVLVQKVASESDLTKNLASDRIPKVVLDNKFICT